MKGFLFKLLYFVAVLLFGIQNVYSQVVPPANLDAGAIDKATKDNFSQLENVTPVKKTEPVIKPLENKNETPGVLHTQRFDLNKIVFTGNSVIKTGELEKLSTGLVGKNVAVSDMVELTNQISAVYRDRGYLTSFAYIPPQKIENGVIKINVMEGKVGNISIQGNRWAKSSYIQRNILTYNDFQGQKIFNANNLRKSLGDMNEKSYLKGQATLQRGVAPETTDIVLNVKDRLPIELGASWDNTGRDFIGIQKAGISLTDYNLTGYGDSLSTNLSLASSIFGVGTGYSVPLGHKGTELRLGYSMSKVELGGALKSYDFKGRSHDFTFGLYRPLIRKDNFELTSDLNFDMRHSDSTLKGFNYYKYEIRVLRAGLNANKYDSKGRWITRLEADTGIPILGGKSSDDSSVGSSKFFKLNTTLARVQANLPFKSTGVFRVSGQFSPFTMLAPEQMQLGGMYSVRGYTEGLMLGDAGYNMSLEMRTPLSFFPEKITIPVPFMKEKPSIPLKNRIQFVSFYDQGLAMLLHQPDYVKKNNFLQSVGVGLRCYLTNNISANVDFGIPLGADKALAPHFGRVHFSLSSTVF